jgi:8-amino-7-oxononanoate synthase
MYPLTYMQHVLHELQRKGNLRTLTTQHQEGKYIEVAGRRMLNLSSNDYLGLGGNTALRKRFCRDEAAHHAFTSASSRLLTGNRAEYEELEQMRAAMFGTEAALVFNSGYHANTGILPAVADAHTLILADKLVHASLIDGIRLSAARCIRYRHNDMTQLERLIDEHHRSYRQIIIVTESVFSMDGDTADIRRLVELKKKHQNILLYVDEAHAFFVRGREGLGVAEEADCIGDVDFLVGTFGKAAASVGAYVVCREVVRRYLINRMRTFIFSTALPPVNVAWTQYVLDIDRHWLAERRQHLQSTSERLRAALLERGYNCTGDSHIVPWIIGSAEEAVRKSEELQRAGFYALAVRPPTVPEGTSRIRFSLTADITDKEIEKLITLITT